MGMQEYSLFVVITTVGLAVWSVCLSVKKIAQKVVDVDVIREIFGRVGTGTKKYFGGDLCTGILFLLHLVIFTT